MLKTAVPTKIVFRGLKTAPFGIFLSSWKSFKQQTLKIIKKIKIWSLLKTLFYSKKNYKKLAKKLWLSNWDITLGYNPLINSTWHQSRSQHFLGLGSLALAAGSCIFLDFILGSESNVRHWQGVTQVTIRHALTGGWSVRSQHFLGLGSLALAACSCIFLDFILGSESNVRHWQGVTQVTIRHALTGGWSVRSQHVLGLGSLALAAGSCIFLDFILGSDSNVRHWQGVTQVTIRHALTGGWSVRSQHFFGSWIAWLWPRAAAFFLILFSGQKATLGTGKGWHR